MTFADSLRKALKGARSATDKASGGIEQLRDLRVRLLDERDRVSATAMPRDEAVAALDEALDQAAEGAVAGFNAVSFARPSGGRVGVNIGGTTERLLALQVATNRPAIRDLLIAEIDDAYSRLEAMPAEEKARTLDRLDREIFDVELAEEAAIRAAEAAGMLVQRRRDADPRAVLADDDELPG